MNNALIDILRNSFGLLMALMRVSWVHKAEYDSHEGFFLVTLSTFMADW